MPPHSVARVAKKPLRLDDELQFIRSWIDKPLRTGAVMPSSKALARAMARPIDPDETSPVIELGPDTRPETTTQDEHENEPTQHEQDENNPDNSRLLRT